MSGRRDRPRPGLRAQHLATRDDQARAPTWSTTANRRWIPSGSRPLRAISQAMNEFEFHISPAWSSSTERRTSLPIPLS
jgi:hypothetical protein